MDYLVINSSESILDEPKIWECDLYELVKRQIIKGFDIWVEKMTDKEMYGKES